MNWQYALKKKKPQQCTTEARTQYQYLMVANPANEFSVNSAAFDGTKLLLFAVIKVVLGGKVESSLPPIPHTAATKRLYLGHFLTRVRHVRMLVTCT